MPRPGARRREAAPPRREARPRKALGQHFLRDGRMAARIAAAAGELAGRTVLEVGPGRGALTRALLATGIEKLVAIERDSGLAAALGATLSEHRGRLRVIEGDALEIDESAILGRPACVVSNLPYNISVPLLMKWLRDPSAYESITLMVQKEVAGRIVAPTRTKAYGRLSVMVQWRCTAERLFDVPPGAFVPAPKVTSSLVRLVPRPEPLAPATAESLTAVVAAAFGQRRKMLRSSLRSLGLPAAVLIEAAGLDATARAEEIDVAGFCALARAYVAQREARTRGARP